MNLSGTSWGELPNSKELNIPYFMTTEYVKAERKMRDAEEMRINARMANKRRRIRRELISQKLQQHTKLYFACMVAFLMIVGWCIR